MWNVQNDVIIQRVNYLSEALLKGWVQNSQKDQIIRLGTTYFSVLTPDGISKIWLEKGK